MQPFSRFHLTKQGLFKSLTIMSLAVALVAINFFMPEGAKGQQTYPQVTSGSWPLYNNNPATATFLLNPNSPNNFLRPGAGGNKLTDITVRVNLDADMPATGVRVYVKAFLKKGTTTPTTTISPPDANSKYQCAFAAPLGNNMTQAICGNSPWLFELKYQDFQNDQNGNPRILSKNFPINLSQWESDNGTAEWKFIFEGAVAYVTSITDDNGYCGVNNVTCTIQSSAGISNSFQFKTKYWPLVNYSNTPQSGYCTDFTGTSPAPTWQWNYEQSLAVPYPPTGYQVYVLKQQPDLSWQKFPANTGGINNGNSRSFTLPQIIDGQAVGNGKYTITVEARWRPDDGQSALGYNYPAHIETYVQPTGSVTVNTAGCGARPSTLLSYNSGYEYQDPLQTDVNHPLYLVSPNANPNPYPERTNIPAVIVFGKDFVDDQTGGIDDKKCVMNGQSSPQNLDLKRPVFKFIYSQRTSDKEFGFRGNGTIVQHYYAQLQEYANNVWTNNGSEVEIAVFPNYIGSQKFQSNCWFPTATTYPAGLDRSKTYRLKVQAESAGLRSDIAYRELPPGGYRPSVLQYQNTNPLAFTYSDYIATPTTLPDDSSPAVQVATSNTQTEYGVSKPSTCGGQNASATQPVWSWESDQRAQTYPTYRFGFKANGTGITLTKYVLVLQRSANSGSTWTDSASDNNYTTTCYRPISALDTTSYQWRLKVTAYDSQPNGGNPSDTVVRTLSAGLGVPNVTSVFPTTTCAGYTVPPLFKNLIGPTMIWQWGYTQPGDPSQHQQFIIKLQKVGQVNVVNYTFNPNSASSYSAYNNDFRIDYASGVLKVTAKLTSSSSGLLKYLLNKNPSMGDGPDVNGEYSLKVTAQLVSDPATVSLEKEKVAKSDLHNPNFPLGNKIENSPNPTQELGWDDGVETWATGVSVYAGGFNMPVNVTKSGIPYTNPYTAQLNSKIQSVPSGLKWPVEFSHSPVFAWLAQGRHDMNATIADNACYDWGFWGLFNQNQTSKSWTLQRTGPPAGDATLPVARPMTKSEYESFVDWRYSACLSTTNALTSSWTAQQKQSRCQTDKDYLLARKQTCDPADYANLDKGPDQLGQNYGAYVWTRNSPSPTPRDPALGDNSACGLIAGSNDYGKVNVTSSDNSPVLAFVVEDQGDLACNGGGSNSVCPSSPYLCSLQESTAGCYCRGPSPVMPSCGSYTMAASSGVDDASTSIEMALNGGFGVADFSLYLPFQLTNDYTRKLNLLTTTYPPAVRCDVGSATAKFQRCFVMIRLPDFIWDQATGTGNTFPYFEPTLDVQEEWKVGSCWFFGGGNICPTADPPYGFHGDRPDNLGSQYIQSTFKTASSIAEVPKYSSPSVSPYRYQAWYLDNSLGNQSQAYHLRVNMIDANGNTNTEIIKFRINQNTPDVGQ